MNIGSSIAMLVIAAAALASGAAMAAAPPVVQSVTLEGDAVLGGKLRAVVVASGDPVPDIAYTWLRCFPERTALCEPIAAADSDSYTPVPADVGSLLAVVVTARNGSGSDTERSATVGPVRGSEYELPRDPAAPRRPYIIPFPVVRISGRIASGGSFVSLLRVSAPPRARVDVRCAGRRCPVRHRTRGPGRVRALERFLPRGTRITIRVRRRAYIGKYVRIRIRSGRAPARRDACVLSLTRDPVRCPTL